MQRSCRCSSLRSVPLCGAQKIAAPVSSLRVYLFDCGLIKGENPLSYGLNKGDVKNPDMVVPCYLIVHPKGTLMWDVGVIPDSAFKEGKPVTEEGDTVSSPRPLLPQLAALGYPADKITYIAFSHYHFDHTANANAFAGSTWLVHAAERDAMFAASAEHIATYNRAAQQQDDHPAQHGLRCLRRRKRRDQIRSRSYARPPGSGLEAAQDWASPDCGRLVALCGGA